MIASLPRGATRRLYTAPHSLLDTSPAQLPRQLLDTVASTNVLHERTRVSPVSSAASSHSSESVKAGHHQHTAAPAPQLPATTPDTVTAAAAASSWRPVSTFQALNHDLISSQADSSFQFPAFAAPSISTSHTARPTTAEARRSFQPVESSPSHQPLPAQRGFQQSSPETESAQQTNPVPDVTAQAHLTSSEAPAAGHQSERPVVFRHKGCASSPHSSLLPGSWSQNNLRTAGDVSNLQAGAQQPHGWQATHMASNPAQVSTLKPNDCKLLHLLLDEYTIDLHCIDHECSLLMHLCKAG